MEIDDQASNHAELIPVDSTPASPVGFLRNMVLDEQDIVAPDPAAWEEADVDPLADPLADR